MKENKYVVMGQDVKSMLNMVSGAYAIPLIDQLFSEKKDVSDMEDIYFALVTLKEDRRITEAMNMVRGLFGIAGMEYPDLVAAIESGGAEREIFLSEFLEDFYEIIDERRIICE